MGDRRGLFESGPWNPWYTVQGLCVGGENQLHHRCSAFVYSRLKKISFVLFLVSVSALSFISGTDRCEALIKWVSESQRWADVMLDDLLYSSTRSDEAPPHSFWLFQKFMFPWKLWWIVFRRRLELRRPTSSRYRTFDGIKSNCSNVLATFLSFSLTSESNSPSGFMTKASAHVSLTFTQFHHLHFVNVLLLFMI